MGTSPPSCDRAADRARAWALRWGEAVALRRGSVDLTKGRLIVKESLPEIGGELTFGPTKSHAERTVRLTRPLVRVLRGHLDERVGRDTDA
jgi:integrase